MAGQVNWVQQPDHGVGMTQAFQQGYNTMDALYKGFKENQLRSKLGELYAQNPNAEPMETMKKAIPLLAMYDSPEKALALQSSIAQSEQASQLRRDTLTQQALLRRETLDQQKEESERNRQNRLDLANLAAANKQVGSSSSFDDESLRTMAQKEILEDVRPQFSNRDLQSRSAYAKTFNSEMANMGITAKDLPVFRASYKANASSLQKQTQLYDSISNFGGTMQQLAQDIGELRSKMNLSPNKIFQAGQIATGRVLGNPQLRELEALVVPVANEYARIMNTAGGTGQTSVDARKEAEHLMNVFLSGKESEAVANRMIREVQIRQDKVREQIQQVGNRMTNITDSVKSLQSGNPQQQQQQPTGSPSEIQKTGDTTRIGSQTVPIYQDKGGRFVVYNGAKHYQGGAK